MQQSLWEQEKSCKREQSRRKENYKKQTWGLKKAWLLGAITVKVRSHIQSSRSYLVNYTISLIDIEDWCPMRKKRSWIKRTNSSGCGRISSDPTKRLNDLHQLSPWNYLKQLGIFKNLHKSLQQSDTMGPNMHESGNEVGLSRIVKACILWGFLQNLLDSRFSFDGFPECGGLETTLRVLTGEGYLIENPPRKAGTPENNPPQGKSGATYL